MLDIGDIAPEIALEDTTGQPVVLSSYQGARPVLIYFMRSVSCPICNRHVKDLVMDADRLAADNIEVLIAVPEGRTEAAAWLAGRTMPFSVVTGRAGTAHQAVGLMKKVFGAMQQSGTLLIDDRGVVRYALAATVPTGGYDKAGLARAIETLRTTPA